MNIQTYCQPRIAAYLDYLDFHEKFGQEGNVMVFAIQDKDFYQLDKINDWISMCDSLKSLHGIVALVDITHSFNLCKDTLNKKFDIQPIFPNHIKNQQELDSLVNIIENLPFYDGTLFNKTKDIYGMMVSVSAEVMNSPARVGLVKEILEITEHFSDKYNLQMHYSGLPYIRVVNAENIKGEMYMFIILVAINNDIHSLPIFPFLPNYRFLFVNRTDLCQLDGRRDGHVRYQNHVTHGHVASPIDCDMHSQPGIHDQ